MDFDNEEEFDEVEDRSEELRDTLLQYTDTEVLQALLKSTIIDQDTGMLTDYWLSLLNPNLHTEKTKDLVSEQEDVVLSAFAKILAKRMK